MLHVYAQNYGDSSSLVVRKVNLDMYCYELVEIYGCVEQEIAAAVINNYRTKLCVADVGPAVLVEAGDEEEELFETLVQLRRMGSPIRRNDGAVRLLLKNPTLEGLKGFLGLKRLVEGAIGNG